MVIICQQCDARLQLDDTKVPARTFTVRCPKCQHIINAQPPTSQNEQGALGLSGDPVAINSRFERPRPAPAYRPDEAGAESAGDAGGGAAPDEDEVAQLLSSLLQRAMSTAATEASKTSRRRLAHHRVLICATEEHRFAVARALVENGYEAYVAEDTTQAIERMREEQMDVVILDPNFDPPEQGAAFIKREVSALRPAARRHLFFVHLSPNARSGDQHLAFINHANLTINPTEIEEMPDVLERSIRSFNELYCNFNKAMQVADF